MPSTPTKGQQIATLTQAIQDAANLPAAPTAEQQRFSRDMVAHLEAKKAALINPQDPYEGLGLDEADTLEHDKKNSHPPRGRSGRGQEGLGEDGV